jgi:hypothetical protein
MAELAVGEVARGGAEGVGVGVGRHQRHVGERGHVPEASLVEVREVHQDAEAVALAHQVPARARETGAGVGRGPKAEGDAVSVGVRAAPHEAERTQPHPVEILERARVGAEVLRPLEVQDRGKHAVAQAPGELPDSTRHLQPPFGFDLEPK